MKTALLGATALVLAATSASAIGLDRSGQDVGVIFENSDHVTLSFGRVRPDLTGTDVLGVGIDDVGEDFNQVSLGYNQILNENLSFGLIFDQPYGADIAYGPASPLLGGTRAQLDSQAITALLRYRLGNGFSVHGGLKYERIDAGISLGGAAYGPLDGYNVELDSSSDVGYVAGVAYERPDIALRVSLTYSSGTTHEFDSTETLNGVPIGALPVAVTGGLDGVGVTEVETPDSLNLDFQTGVAEGTLVFGSIRHARYEDTLVSPEFFAAATGGASLTDIDNGTSYSLGVGRAINDQLSVLASIGYESGGDDDLVSPLAPTNGTRSITLGARYAVTEALAITGGLTYAKFGDAQPETGTPDTARATFEDNDAIGLGVSFGYSF
ncbi:MAG: OmpP1/FadL family transporter [Paracoccaceae bacterium]